jgi:putative transposase
VPKAFPAEFRRDVVAVARKGQASLAQIAKDFGISESCLHRWVKLAGSKKVCVRPSPPRTQLSFVRCGNVTGYWNRRTRSCAGSRPTSSPVSSPKMTYPLVEDLAADGFPVAVWPRFGVLQAGLLPMEGRSGIAARRGRRVLDQRRVRHPPRRSGVRLPVHRQRTGRPRKHASGSRVARLCSMQRIWSVFAKKRGLSRRSGPPPPR